MIPPGFFDLDPYHIILAVIGLTVIVARWLPRLVSRREPAAAPLMLIIGAGLALALPGLAILPDPVERPRLWELMSELAVITALFGTGLRIDKLGPLTLWAPTLRMLVIAMPLTILAIAVLGAGLPGVTVSAAILLGAVLAPTDPVLAADVQVGPPQEGQEHPVRFTLTTEAGLNDGLAFPFVYLALIVAAEGWNGGAWLGGWFAQDVVWRIGVGTFMGWAGARLLGHVLFALPRDAPLATTGSGVIALAGVLLCYGTTELIEGYGFIAVAVLGFTLRRIEQHHAYHRRLHDFSESIEHAMTAILLVALGVALPGLVARAGLAEVALALAVLVVVRPLAGWIALLGSGLDRPGRGLVAVYGVRGIGSVYYLAYAAGHNDTAGFATLWPIMALVILFSTILHGFSVGWAMSKVDPAAEQAPPP